MFGWLVVVQDMGLSMDQLWVNMLLPESKEVMKESNQGLVWRVRKRKQEEWFINHSVCIDEFVRVETTSVRKHASA